jgi:hypothetical protein
MTSLQTQSDREIKGIRIIILQEWKESNKIFRNLTKKIKERKGNLQVHWALLSIKLVLLYGVFFNTIFL